MLAKSWSCRWGKNGKLYSRERAYEVDKNALITWRIFPVCATTPVYVTPKHKDCGFILCVITIKEGPLPPDEANRLIKYLIPRVLL